MRRILLVTTQSAQNIVKEVSLALQKSYQVDIYVSKAVVAQFTNCEELSVELRERIGRCDYDLVLIPGLVRGSTEVIERAIGCEVFKGPRYAGDIPLALELVVRGFKLSREIPADVLYSEYFSSRVMSMYSQEVSSKKPLFELGDVGVFLDPPPIRLLLEVVVSNEEVFNEKIARATEFGFDGIVVGCGSSCAYTELEKHVGRVRERGVKVVGVDAPRVLEVPRDLLENVDLVFNVTQADAEKVVDTLNRRTAVVVIPSTLESLEMAIQSIEKAVSTLREAGLEKILVDPLVKPPGTGFAESITRFSYSRRRVSYPHLFSTANVYELIDADSHGVIALLLALAMEIGASVVLATEESTKSFGAVEEHSIARYMAYASYLKKSPPKDVPGGVDLLIVKEKRLKNTAPPDFSGPTEYVGTVELREDPKYFVKIYVDFTKNAVVVDVHSAKSGVILGRFVGTHSTSLARAVLRKFDLTLEHAAYLGYELCKAELALRFRKSYEQDRDVLTSSAERARRFRKLLSSLL